MREHLRIDRLHLVIGGSMGGMQTLEWGITYPDRVGAIVPIATCARMSARGIAFNEIARRAICLDPRWKRGEYYDDPDGGPDAGLSLARMIATITYLSDELMHQQFGRNPAPGETALERDLYARFDVERYLHDEGAALVKRFDANSYLYLTKAVDLHDISRGYPSLDAALSRLTLPAPSLSPYAPTTFSRPRKPWRWSKHCGAGGRPTATYATTCLIRPTVTMRLLSSRRRCFRPCATLSNRAQVSPCRREAFGPKSPC